MRERIGSRWIIKKKCKPSLGQVRMGGGGEERCKGLEGSVIPKMGRAKRNLEIRTPRTPLFVAVRDREGGKRTRRRHCVHFCGNIHPHLLALLERQPRGLQAEQGEEGEGCIPAGEQLDRSRTGHMWGTMRNSGWVAASVAKSDSP